MVNFPRPSTWTRRKTVEPRDDVSLLQSLAEQGKFEKFLKRLKEMDNETFLLEHKSGLFIKEGEENSTKTCSSSSSSILHVALANRAPLCVVETLLHRIKECCAVLGNVTVVPEEIQDASGRIPLHVAAENGCNVNVIERLLCGETLIAPAYTKDKYGRFPLHWACCLPSRDSGEKRTKQKKTKHGQQAAVYYKGKKEIRRETIYLLLNAYPLAVLVPDIFGMTPLDYARSIHLDAHPMQALVRVAKAHYGIKFLAARGASKFVTTSTSANNNKRFSPLSSPNSLETTERESTDNDEDDEEGDVGSFSGKGMLPFGELLIHAREMDDVSSVGSSQEGHETASPMTTAIATHVFSGMHWIRE